MAAVRAELENTEEVEEEEVEPVEETFLG